MGGATIHQEFDMQEIGAICPRCGSSIELCDLCAILGLGICLGIMFSTWAIGACNMAGRDRKLRKKGAMPEHEVPKIARQAVGEELWGELSEHWRNEILVAVLDAQPDGREAMLTAAHEALQELYDIRAARRMVRDSRKSDE